MSWLSRTPSKDAIKDVLAGLDAERREAIAQKVRQEIEADVTKAIQERLQAEADDNQARLEAEYRNKLAAAKRELDVEMGALLETERAKIRSELKDDYNDRAEGLKSDLRYTQQERERCEAALIALWCELLPRDGKSANLQRRTGIQKLLHYRVHQETLKRHGLTLWGSFGTGTALIPCQLSDNATRGLERFSLRDERQVEAAAWSDDDGPGEDAAPAAQAQPTPPPLPTAALTDDEPPQREVEMGYYLAREMATHLAKHPAQK